MKMKLLVTLVSLLLLSGLAWAQEPKPCEGGICVPPEHIEAFVGLLERSKCMQETPPKVTLDPITIIADEEGRIYTTGDKPHPYRIHIDWCDYEITGEGKIKLLVAKMEPPVWGFRFRPKFTAGYLPVLALKKKDAYSGIDAGILWDVFHYQWLNFNISTGLRSSGVGLGADLTRNFGVYAGYAIAYDGWVSNPHAGLYFSFW